jgi:hypothetical protein
MTMQVTARCIGCKATREIGPGEVPEGEMPMCSACFLPMVAERASSACGRHGWRDGPLPCPECTGLSPGSAFVDHPGHEEGAT